MTDFSQGQDVAPSLSQAQFLRLALDALSARIARWVVLLLSFALFAACMWKPSWVRLATASVFTVLMYFPIAFKKEVKHG